MFDDETPIAWTALPRDAPVVAADATEIGRVRYVIGDQQEDIFHGIAMRRAKDGETVEVPWKRITRLTDKHVVTDLGDADADTLLPYRER